MSTVISSYQLFSGTTAERGVSEEADMMLVQLKEIAEIYHSAAAGQRESISQKFYKLVNQWKRDVRFVSSVTDMVLHPAYLQIIGLGEKVLPLLLAELNARPDYYFWALEALTGHDPVPTERKGDFDSMTELWLDWGKANGFID